MQRAIVVNETKLLEFIHEEIHPRSRGADHFRERFLGYLGDKFVRLVILSITSQQEESASEPFLGRIEELVSRCPERDTLQLW